MNTEYHILFESRRLSLNMNVSELARQVGTSSTKMRDFFKGSGVSYFTFIDIARVLGYDIERFILANSKHSEFTLR